MQARKKLNQELDISKFIKNIRLLRNSLKFLTDRRERYLVRMQADKNVITQKPENPDKITEG